MNQSNALRKPIIAPIQIENLLAMRESLDSLKKRYQLLEDSVKATEQEIIEQIEQGAEIAGRYVLQIRATERRFPSWKNYFVEVAGCEAAERILLNTIPTVYKNLIIN